MNKEWCEGQIEQALQFIKDGIADYGGEDNFYISFSGGKDSTVLSHLVDEAIPGNKIPRVYVETPVELSVISDFVKGLAAIDKRIVILHSFDEGDTYPDMATMLRTEGYPFKSKKHAMYVKRYWNHEPDAMIQSVRSYIGMDDKYGSRLQCPKCLKYQFTPGYCDKFRISDMCQTYLKIEPLNRFRKKSGRMYSIIGTMRAEKGRRERLAVRSIKGNDMNLQPMAYMSEAAEEYYISTRQIELSEAYTKYGLKRTGCTGCPNSLNLAGELQMLKANFPEDYKRCISFFGPVYDEYRRIGYRLKDEQISCNNQKFEQLSIFDVFGESA